MIKIKKGLDLPINGAPLQIVDGKKVVTKFAITGDDYIGMKPSMLVNVGDTVKIGQKLFSDKKTDGVFFTSPVAGEVIELNRGARRAFESIVIKENGDDEVNYSAYKDSSIDSYSRDELTALLTESGVWPAFRTRPFSKIADPKTNPHSIFITAMDTNPLAPSPGIFISQSNEEAFKVGLAAITKLTDGAAYLCKAIGDDIPTIDGVTVKEFSGKHPAGNVGTHIHFVDPVSANKFVWHINYQDVIALGSLIQTGKYFAERLISIAGPMAKNPRLVLTKQGACICELVDGEKNDGDVRAISGSVFAGRTSAGALCYLGRYHHQVSLLEEGTKREFLGWHSPGLNKFSVQNIYLSKLIPKMFNFNTSTNGSVRSIVPIGSYEKVMPLDIQPTFLLRSMMSRNTDMSQKLGILELDEEDLALCTFVDPCKNEFGPVLRDNLNIIEKDG